MAFDTADIVRLVDLAVKRFAREEKTPIINVSYDGDHKSCEVIVDVENFSKHTKEVCRQSFVISSEQVKEIPYEKEEST